ncbi:MAG: FG-GAP repeat-containing protein/FG-GAP repeat-containing protein [Verrucomicrobia bacterium]|nr:MAG: FG-GAP repeat-containing protein/FG-GAP repeat-containing protein [Verrucomicrobiota bacterium]
MTTSRFVHTRLLVALALGAFLPSAASGTDLSSQKLFGRWVAYPANFFLGLTRGSLALTEKWAVVASNQASDRGPSSEGALQVFDARTGAWVRRIYPPLPNGNYQFGYAVAVSGDLALVGAPIVNSSFGAAYLVDLQIGRVLRTLTGPGIGSPVGFAYSVAIGGDTLAVGAPLEATGDGAIYLFRRSSGAFLAKFSPPVAGTAEAYGQSLAIDGTILAVGASKANANRGAVYFYDTVSGLLIERYQPLASAAGDRVGETLAMHRGYTVLGTAPGGSAGAFLYNPVTGFGAALTPPGVPTNTYGDSVAVHGSLIAVGEPRFGLAGGAVHLFRTETGVHLETVRPPLNPESPVEFGTAVALHQNNLLASAPADDIQAPDSGAAFLLRPFTQPMLATKAIAQGDAAPTFPDVSVGRIGDAFINSEGETAFVTSLSGGGSNLGRDLGAVSEVTGRGTFTMPVKSRQSLGARVVTVGPVTMNDSDTVVGLATVSGPGLVAPANQLIWYQASGSFAILAASGQGSLLPGGGKSAALPECVTSNQFGQRYCGFMLTLKPEAATGTTLNNDSGLVFVKLLSSFDGVREGLAAPAPVGAEYGQFAPRISWFYDRIVFSTALRNGGVTAATNAAVFAGPYLAAPTLIAQKGDLAVDATGGVLPGEAYSTFVGETSFRSGATCYRALLGAVPVSRNDGIWRLSSDGATRRRLIRKGDLVGNPAGLVTRIHGFWPVGSDQLLAWVTVAGPGITASNDQVLVLIQSDLVPTSLMQEGSVAPGCGETARIGTILRVEVDGWTGAYAVLASLSNASPTNNLALFTGNTGRGNLTNQQALRRPQLRLRKGQLFTNQPGALRSISLPAANRPASGAGGTGRGRAISWDGDLTFVAEFDNGVRQVMRGTAD